MVRKVGWFLLFLLGAMSILFLVVLGVLLLPSALLARIAPDVPPGEARRVVAAVLATGVAMILTVWATPRAGMSRWWGLGMLLPVLNILGMVLLSWRLARHTVDGPPTAPPLRPGTSRLGVPLAAVLVVALFGVSGAAAALTYWAASVPSASTGASEVSGPPIPSSGGSSATGRPALPYRAYGGGLRAGQVVEIRRGDTTLVRASADAQGHWSIDLPPNLYTSGETLSLWVDGLDSGQRFKPLGGQSPVSPGFALAGTKAGATTASATTASATTGTASSGTADALPSGCGLSDVPYKAYGSGISPRQRVEAFFNGARVGQTIADDAGNWSFNIDPKPPLVAGARVTFSVDGRDIPGVDIRFCSAQFPRPPGIALGLR